MAQSGFARCVRPKTHGKGLESERKRDPRRIKTAHFHLKQTYAGYLAFPEMQYPREPRYISLASVLSIYLLGFEHLQINVSWIT